MPTLVALGSLAGSAAKILTKTDAPPGPASLSDEAWSVPLVRFGSHASATTPYTCTRDQAGTPWSASSLV